jgi:hypothetical protein
MIEATARATAYIAGRLVTREEAGAMVDRVSGARARFVGDVRADHVLVTDLGTSRLVTGRAAGHGRLWLFHQGTRRFLSLSRESAGVFSGLDYSTGHAFDVLADGHGAVELLDYQTGSWRRYQLELARDRIGSPA